MTSSKTDSGTSLEEQLRGRMAHLRISQANLAYEVAELMGEQPMTQTAVIKWLRRPENLPPARLFAIERVLQVQPGYYTRQLGYLPVAARKAPEGVEASLMADPDLTEVTRAALLGAYRGIKSELAKTRKRRAPGNGKHLT